MPPYRSGAKILIVDDEALIRSYVRDIVEEIGYAASEAGNADAALQMLGKSGFSVVLTDITMPGTLDGLELAWTIRSKWPGVAVVIMSGRRLPWPHELPDSVRLLTKPFSPDSLIALLTDLI